MSHMQLKHDTMGKSEHDHYSHVIYINSKMQENRFMHNKQLRGKMTLLACLLSDDTADGSVE